MEFSFFSMISQASLVAKIVLCILVLMSVGSWGMMIQKTLALNAAYRKALQGTDLFEKAPSLREAVLSLGSDRASPLYFVAHQGVMEFNRSKEAGNSSEIVVDNVRRSLRRAWPARWPSGALPLPAGHRRQHGSLHRPVRYGVGHHALLPLHRHAQVRLPGHGGPRHLRSLVATAIGLGVAVPATIGFNIFMGKLSQVDTLLVNFAGVFLNRVQRELNAHRPVQRTGATEM